MPDRGRYTITVTRFLPSAETHDVMEYVETHERATLGDTRDLVIMLCAGALPARELDRIEYLIGVNGGAITLPDGTTIEVAPKC